MSLMIKEEVGPVWIRLHVSELKQFPEAQDQDLFTNLTRPKVKKHVSQNTEKESVVTPVYATAPSRDDMTEQTFCTQ